MTIRPFRHIRAAYAAIGLIALSACGGASEEDIQQMMAAIEALRPGMDRIAAVHAALPARGAEREVPLKAAIPSEGLETVDLAHLELVLDLPRAPDSEPRHYLVSEAFNGQHISHLTPDPEPNFASALNIRSNVDALATVKHVAVFRPSSVDKGQIGGQDGEGRYVIERGAQWRGWVFVFAFEDPPRLVASLPLEAKSREEMTLVVTEGYRPPDDALLDDAVFVLRRDTLARLTGAR